MYETRPILYGVADYAEIRRANAWFVGGVLVFHGADCVLSEEV